MHPAYSVIAFTTASGAGYGLLFWLAVLVPSGRLPPSPWLGFTGLGLAFLLICGGLLSSTAHLGRPERAWRAFSQWRTSWLSREGVAAVATFIPMALLALGWIVLGSTGGFFALMAYAAAALAVVTVACTGMIYQSLPTIKAWSQPLVTPVYLVLALATGGVLAVLMQRLNGFELPRLVWATVALLGLALVMKRLYWSRIDGRPDTRTPGDATGLGRFGEVRQLEAPHTQENYVMREMGFAVGRRHAAKLRHLVTFAGLLLPMLLLVLSLVTGPGLALLLSLAATAAVGFGVLVERWLFFAEARHIAMLYYGR